MNVCEYIVKILKEIGINHFFGYQGTMITNFVDAIYNEGDVNNHSCYNEQGAALAACGYAKASGKIGVAYATSGPGAINLLQGIADAYYDSVPVLFITGQLNKKEYSFIDGLRQQGFQETNIVEITRTITKYNAFVESPYDIVNVLSKAISECINGRKGSVLIDLPMDIQKSQLDISDIELAENINYVKSLLETKKNRNNIIGIAQNIAFAIEESHRPIFLLGNGISKDYEMKCKVYELIRKYKIPVLSSLMAIDIIPQDSGLYYGFIGASYGQRSGNIIANAKADLIVSLGCRLCTRQTGVCQEEFALNAKIIRVDIDENELRRKVHDDDFCYYGDVNILIEELLKCSIEKKFDDWISVCDEIKRETSKFDATCITRFPNKFVEMLSEKTDFPTVVASDVGQNMIWVAQSFVLRKGQSIIFSGAHGSMGFALPAAIGAYYATNQCIICISGDGGFQMNIQELQWVVRENLPIKIFVFNNQSLGMICQVQDSYLEGRRVGTSMHSGFLSPSFAKIADAYGIRSYKTKDLNEFDEILQMIMLKPNEPNLVEIVFDCDTEAHPKTYFGERIDNQRPYLPKNIYERLMSI